MMITMPEMTPMELEIELSGSESNLLDEGSGDKLPNS